MNEQRLIIIDGLNGSGKTTVSHLLHKKLKHTALISFDKIKFLISDYNPNEEYIALTSRVLQKMVKEYLDSGLGVILENIFPKSEFMEPYLKIASKRKISVSVYQIEAPFEIRAQRIMQRPVIEGAKVKMTKKWIKRNDENYLSNKYEKAKIIQSHDKSPEQIMHIIMKDIAK